MLLIGRRLDLRFTLGEVFSNLVKIHADTLSEVLSSLVRLKKFEEARVLKEFQCVVLKVHKYL